MARRSRFSADPGDDGFQLGLAQEMPQVVSELFGRRIPVGRPLKSALKQIRSSSSAIAPSYWRGGQRLGPEDLPEQFFVGIGEERLALGAQFIQDYAQAENVGPPVNPMGLAASLFRTHVGRRAREAAIRDRRGCLRWEGHRQAEVGDIGSILGIEQDVRRLDVPMDEAVAVCMIECLGNRQNDPNGFLLGEPSLAHASRQIAAADQLRYDVAAPGIRSPQVVDWNNGGVVQAGDDSCLGEVSSRLLWIGDSTGVRDLDGNFASQFFIPGKIDSPERPSPNSCRTW